MGFAGMDRDKETDLYYNWHRLTQNGRWLGPDREGFKTGDTISTGALVTYLLFELVRAKSQKEQLALERISKPVFAS